MNNQFVSITNFNNVLLYLLDKHALVKLNILMIIKYTGSMKQI